MNKIELSAQIKSSFFNGSPIEQASIIDKLIMDDMGREAGSTFSLLMSASKTDFLPYIRHKIILYKWLENIADSILEKISKELFWHDLSTPMLHRNMFGSFMEFVPKKEIYSAIRKKLSSLNEGFEKWETLLKTIREMDAKSADDYMFDLETSLGERRLTIISWIRKALDMQKPSQRLAFYETLSVSEMKKIFWIGVYHYNFTDYISFNSDSIDVLFGFIAPRLRGDESTSTMEDGVEEWKRALVDWLLVLPDNKMKLFISFILYFDRTFTRVLTPFVQALSQKRLRPLLKSHRELTEYFSVAQSLSGTKQSGLKMVAALLEKNGDADIPITLQRRINKLPVSDRICLLL